MPRLILLFSVFSIVNFSLQEDQHFETTEKKLYKACRDKIADGDQQTQFLTIRSSDIQGDDDRQSFQRSNTRLKLSSRARSALAKLDFNQIIARVREFYQFYIQSRREGQISGLDGAQGSTSSRRRLIIERLPSRQDSSTTYPDWSQVPAVFRGIFEDCVPNEKGNSKEEEDPFSNNVATECIIEEVVKLFPYNVAFQIAKAVAFDILIIDGQEIYTPKSVIDAAAGCSEQCLQTRQLGEPSQNIFWKCYSEALIRLHPLQQYAPAAITTKVNGFFEYIAKLCHDKVPQDLTSRIELSKYYLQCFIDLACEGFRSSFLVRAGHRWLEPYIDNPDSTFNQEKVFGLAEECEEKTKNIENTELKTSTAFTCFFDGLMSLHSRTRTLVRIVTKRQAQNPTDDVRPKSPERTYSPPKKSRSLDEQSRQGSPIQTSNGHAKSPEGTHSPVRRSGSPDGHMRTISSPAKTQKDRPKSKLSLFSMSKKQRSTSKGKPKSPQESSRDEPNGGAIPISNPTEDRPKSSEKQPSTAASKGTDEQNKSILPFLSRDNANPDEPKDLISCMTKAILSVNFFKLATSSVTSAVSSIPLGKASVKAPEESPANIVNAFVTAATPCFRFFERDENGKLVPNTKYAAGTVLEAAKFNPLAGLAITTAEVMAENIRIKPDQGLDINMVGLTKGLAAAALKNNKLSQAVSKMVPGSWQAIGKVVPGSMQQAIGKVVPGNVQQAIDKVVPEGVQEAVSKVLPEGAQAVTKVLPKKVKSATKLIPVKGP